MVDTLANVLFRRLLEKERVRHMEWKSTEKAGIRGGEVGGGRLKFVYFRFAVDNTNGTECARLVLCPDTWAVISSGFLSRPSTG